MKEPSQMSRTAVLVEGALMMGLAYCLSLLPHIELPFGGSITFFHTLPILMMSFRHGGKWGLGTAAVYSLLQALQGMGSILLCKTIGAMVLCALLDYVLAYTILGLAGPLASRFKNRVAGLAAAVVATGLGRLLFSFLSGIILWGEYAPAGTPVWQYSLSYNASWALPDMVIVLAAVLLLSRVKALGLAGAAAEARA